MLNVIIVDDRENFLGDVQNRIMLQDEPVIDVKTTMTSGENLHNAIQQFKPDLIAVCTDVLDTLPGWDFGRTNIVAYGINREDQQIAEENGLLWLGMIKNGTHMVATLEKFNDNSDKWQQRFQEIGAKRNAQKKAPEPVEPDDEEEYEEVVDTDVEDDIDNQAAQVPPGFDSDEEYQAFLQFKKWSKFQNEQTSQADSKPRQSKAQKQVKKPDYTMQEPDDDEEYEEPYRKPARTKNREEKRQEIKPKRQEKRNDQLRNNKQSSASVIREKLRPDVIKDVDTRDDDDNDQGRERVMKKQKAKVVTVYAAKGGVGKTTIATEVATYLALTGHGRGRYKVCIIDYNIDFGDVRAVLGLEDDAIGMYEWAMDIRDQIENGEDPATLTYSVREIERYLQVSEKTGLYALCAPLKHEESQDIGRSELDVMMRNIVENGMFDFVVCDTGNNTRDSSMFALIYADTVLLVATQDVTTATCNSAACDALNEFGLDLAKIRLVINNALPAKVTGISIQEVEEAFPYKCITTIRHDPDIIKANNLSRPIVYQSGHPVTKEFQKIIAYLTGANESQFDKPKKRGLFGRKR